MIEKFRDATPLEFAAFYELGEFIIGDVSAAIKQLMQKGYDGEFIAELAYDLGLSQLSESEKFHKALLETGLKHIPSQKESLWIVFRFFLNKLLMNQGFYMSYLSEVVDLDIRFGDMVDLFERPDCRAYFKEYQKKYPKSKSSKFAGENYGIEKLYALYYQSDDYDVWTEKLENERKNSVIENTKGVIERFYSKNSELPDSLSRIKEMI